MQVIICAAGESKRMGNITQTIPKPLLPLGQKSIIENLIRAVAIESVSEIIIIVGYLSGQIKERIGNNFKGIKISYLTNNIYSESNNMYSIYLAKNRINDDFIFVSGDVYLTSKTCREFIKSGEVDSILVDIDSKYFDSNDPVKVSITNHEITGIDKDLPLGQIDGVAVGMYKLASRTAKEYFKIAGGLIEKGKLYEGYIEPIKILLKKNKFIPFYIGKEKWFDIDTPEEYKNAKIRISEDEEAKK